jgi:pimeloyl-ACP methyl ester carboxylesterase
MENPDATTPGEFSVIKEKAERKVMIHTTVIAGNSVSYIAEGPEDGQTIVIVHGFPDSASSWHPLMLQLADLGYRVVAPFQRGYFPSAIPKDGRYQAGQFAQDLVDFIEAEVSGDVTLVGHDVGALAAYGAATLVPHRVRAVLGMSVPPGLLPQNLLSFDQAKRSFYVWLFQLPIDDAVAGDDFHFIERIWGDWSMPTTDTARSVAQAKDALRPEGHLAAALGFYRALFVADESLAVQQAASESAPPCRFIYLHGAEDGCMGTSVSDHVAERRVIEGANHFIHVDKPAVVLDAIRELMS